MAKLNLCTQKYRNILSIPVFVKVKPVASISDKGVVMYIDRKIIKGFMGYNTAMHHFQHMLILHMD